MNTKGLLLLTLISSLARAEALKAESCTLEVPAGAVQIARLPFPVGIFEHEGIYCDQNNLSALKRVSVLAAGESEPWVFRMSGDFHDTSVIAYPESEGPRSKRSVHKVIPTKGDVCAPLNRSGSYFEFPELEVVKGRKVAVRFHCDGA